MFNLQLILRYKYKKDNFVTIWATFNRLLKVPYFK